MQTITTYSERGALL